MAEKETIGKYLADGTGMPLYQFVNDEAGVSNFSGECLLSSKIILKKTAAPPAVFFCNAEGIFSVPFYD